MVFDKNQKDFLSYAHRRIWANASSLVPPEISLANIHDQRREAFLDLYHWMMEEKAGVSHEGGTVSFANEKYPKMLDAVAEWRSHIAPKRKWTTRYDYRFALNHLDCRIFLPGFRLNYENFRWCMSDEVSLYMAEITAVLSELGQTWTGTRCVGLHCEYQGER